MTIATTKTRDELIEMAGEELLVIGSGQSLEDEDQEKIDNRVDNLFGELSSRGVCYVANDAEIPAEWCGPLAELLANECARIFGKQKLPDQQREAIEDRLKVMVQRIPASNAYLKADTAIIGGPNYSYNRWLNDT
jgi:hypothetical protein